MNDVETIRQYLIPPSVGPIVGCIEPGSVRLCMRASDDVIEPRIGLVILQAQDPMGPIWVDKLYFGDADRDYTGAITIGGLDSGRRYLAWMFTFGSPSGGATINQIVNCIRSTLDLKAVLGPLDGEENRAEFVIPRHIGSKDQSRFAFFLGSCKHPGTVVHSRLAEATSTMMLNKVLKLQGASVESILPHCLVLVGDQIYSDGFGGYGSAAKSSGDFFAAYREAFDRRRPISRVMARCPTYMIWDDHEFADNWEPSVQVPAIDKTAFANAVSAYCAYQQQLYGPGKSVLHNRNFDLGGCGFYLLDTRSERLRNPEPRCFRQNKMFGWNAHTSAPHGGEPSLDALIDWLRKQQEMQPRRPKFIVSPVPIAPSRRDDVFDPGNSDTWNAFPLSKVNLLRAIIDHNIERVVFLSGDYHSSNVTEMTLANGTNRETRTLWSITSSGLFVPFARSLKRDYLMNSKVECDTFDVGDGWSMDYEVQKLGPTELDTEIANYDNFAYFDVTSGPNIATLDISFCGVSMAATKQVAFS